MVASKEDKLKRRRDMDRLKGKADRRKWSIDGFVCLSFYLVSNHFPSSKYGLANFFSSSKDQDGC